jgi:predicted DNA-binding WGR domain protein
MQNLLTVAFEAHHAELNHHRRYEITIGRDLFGDWTVSVRFGRAGHQGREQRFGGAETRELKGIVQERLRRRLSASRRIGCGYRLNEFSAVKGFDVDSWLPSEVLARFLGV